MKNMSIVAKIWLVIGLAVIAFSAVVAVSVFFTAKNNDTTQNMRDYMYDTSKLASQVRSGFTSLDEFFTQAVTLSDPDLLATAQQLNNALQQNLNQLKTLNPQQLSLLNNLQQDADNYASLAGGIAQQFIDGNVDFAKIQSSVTTKTDQFKSLNERFNQFEQQADERFSNAIEDMSSNMDLALTVILVLGSVLILLTAGLGHFIASQISNSARTLGVSLAELASGKGNLASRLPVTGNDELGVVAKQFNLFIQMLQTSFNDLAKTIEPLNRSAKDLATGMNSLEKMTLEQSDNSETVSHSMAEMQLSVRDISQSANDAATGAGKANELAKLGLDKTSHAVKFSQGLSDEIKHAQEVITELAEKTKNMTEILKSINDIADQTNLLALNAAIEAARAGEHGRGFSVVADEVRNLSSKTAKSVTMVQGVLKQLNDNVSGAVSIMSQAVNNAEHSASLASDAGSSIEQINAEIQQISMLNAQIAAATEEQTMVAEQIVSNTAKMIGSFAQTKSLQLSVHGISDDLRVLSESLVTVSSKFET
ncbi:chemotaxis protein [Arsukibacterium sp. MJ3]|uniref:methyl-accepting chemotaxis protein n=1 Tax=Arsukibacterium sp. MJ3 TaxID=1632859 RepID=UPI000626F228|nr:methyl-accepting chemotaxis protein [Arsukibacterium sp. MJ3]KKO48821.1 chemotaxis protein [Arsukibacterium sp. MJ3]